MADYPDLQGIYQSRSRDPLTVARFSLYTEIENALKGIRPTRYDPMFEDDDFTVEFRSIQLAAQDLTALTTKVFNIEVMPTGTTKDRIKADEKVEQVTYGWNSGAQNLGGPSWPALMSETARLQVIFADADIAFFPDHNSKTIFPTVLDPRKVFLPEGWNPLSIVPLDNVLVVEQTTVGALKMRYDPYGDKGIAGALDKQYANGKRSAEDWTPCSVGMFYGSRCWYVETLENDPIRLTISEEGDPKHPGVCPISSMRQTGFDPLFAGQLGLEAALQKVLSQEIQATDQMLHGPITGSKLVGDQLRWDGYNVLDNSVPGDRVIPPQRLAPTSPTNTQRVTAEIMNMLRIANRNPESFQGAGDANSAKAVQALQAGIRSTVQDILWVPIMNGLQDAYEKARQMEINLWPLEKKTVRGKKGKGYFEVSYRPMTDLAEYKARIRVEHDGELGGYQGSLDRQQKYTTGFMSRQTAMEKDPDIRDVNAEIRQIEVEQVDKLIDQVIAAKGETLNVAGLIRVQALIAEGKSKAEAYRQAEEEGAFTPPPAPEMPAPGGAPPGLEGLLGGGGAPALAGPPPSLEEARGF